MHPVAPARLLPMSICLRYLLALICFPPTLSYVLSVSSLSSFLLRTHIHWFIFCLRSGLLLFLAGSATPNPPRMVMPIDPPFYYDLLLIPTELQADLPSYPVVPGLGLVACHGEPLRCRHRRV
ncbi:hypothetical protein EDB83DRAFT_2418000 [Lactarius deliciosus]|nr:hypothetical protein EDB83DRAFT_2418000 [Lactarius deliciosus]